SSSFSSLLRPPPLTTLFPYTTLFRSFATGSDQWLAFSSWPPPTKRTALFLDSSKSLSFDMPKASEGADEYVSDPVDPVPYAAARSEERRVGKEWRGGWAR